MNNLNPIDTTRPDYQDSTKIWKLFAPPGDRFNRVLRKGHTIIFGPRDCGKTMLLRHLSLPVQLKKYGNLMNIPFVGIYIPFSGSMCRPFLEARRKDLSHWELFSHYFCLTFVEVLLDMIIGAEKADISGELRNRLLECIRDNCKFLKVINDVNNWISHIQNILKKDLGDFVEKNMTLSSTDYPTQVEYIHRFIPSLCNQLADIFSRACGKKVLIYLLIDGYEHFQELSPIFNVLIERYGKQNFVLKIGARSFGMFIKKDIWNRDIDPKQDLDDVVSLTFDDPSNPKYLEWAFNIINNHFNESGFQKFKNRDISDFLFGEEDKTMQLFTIEKKLPSFKEKERETRQQKYYGDLCFGLLSSGIVGTFVKLCDKVIRNNAFTSKRKISAVAKEYAKEELGHILARGAPIELQRLVYCLLLDAEKDFKFGKSPEALPYIIHLKENFDGDADKLMPILRKGFEIGVLHSEQMVINEINETISRQFWISLSLLPYWGLKPVVHSINIKDYLISDLIYYTKKPYPNEPGSWHPIAKDWIKPKVSKKKVFLSISFRTKDGYEETRKALKLAIHEYISFEKLSWDNFKYKVDKFCFDADDMIEGGPLREKVRYGLEKANYVLCEIASKNPNVFFELGMVYAFKKPWCPIFNLELFPGGDIAHFAKFLRGTSIVFYNLTKAKQIAKKGDFLRKIFGILMSLEENKPVPVDPLFEYNDIQARPNTFYLAHEEKTFWRKPHQEIVEHLKKAHGYSEVRLPQKLIGKSELIKICYLIKSASLFLIDACENTPELCFQLGYAFGLSLNKKKLLVISLHPERNPVTLWTDMLDIGWSIDNISGDIIPEMDKILSDYKGD